jgi:lysozyme
VKTALLMAVGRESMQISAGGLDLLKRSEGFRSHTYLDAAGLPTIGYGHKLLHPECFLNGISEAQAVEILTNDLRDAERAVKRLARVAMTQGQFDALVDFCFNVGAGKLEASTLLKVLNAGQYAEAAEQLLRWDHVGLQELAGLKARREGEFQLWNSSVVQRVQRSFAEVRDTNAGPSTPL